MKIYISLPITGREAAAREHADKMKAMLSRNGYEVVNPFEIYAGKKANYKDHLCAGQRALMDCDAIMVCKGWEESLGCLIEVFVANRFNIRVFFEEYINGKNMYALECKGY